MDKHSVLLNKVLDYAYQDNLVRLVEMNGSRVNPKIKKDDFQDFDIVFYVKDFHDFIDKFNQMENFGEILVMQTKDDQMMSDEDRAAKWYIFMAQYKDGTRLDLSIKEVDLLPDELNKDSLSKVLIDKDHYDVNHIADETSYFVNPPSKSMFLKAVNEFYWVCPYVGKGIARKQIFYANNHITILRNQLEYMLDWWIGKNKGFKVSVGKGKSRYQYYLPTHWYDLYVKTYTNVDLECMESALFSAITLFDQVCLDLDKDYSFGYDVDIKEKITKFIKERYLKK